MHFKPAAAILAFALANGPMASPILSRGLNETFSFLEEFIEIAREPGLTNGSNIVYYGPSNETQLPTPAVRPEPSRIQERSASICTTTPSLACDSSHQARNGNCKQLLENLQSDQTGVIDLSSSRQICYEGNGYTNQYCCVSWHTPVANLTKGAMVDYVHESKSRLRFPTSQLIMPCDATLWCNLVGGFIFITIFLVLIFFFFQIVFNQCDTNGISGKIENVELAETCTNLCLSNRGTHC